MAAKKNGFRRLTLVLSTMGAVGLVLYGAAGVACYPSDPYADPHGPHTLILAVAFLALAALEILPAAGFFWLRRARPSSRRARRAWMAWVVLSCGINALGVFPLALLAWLYMT